MANECSGKELKWLQWSNERDYGEKKYKQGRIHGNPVADGWAGAVMHEPLEIQKCDRRTDRRTEGGMGGRTEGWRD